MDSMTHIHFAANLLNVAGLDHRAVACSLFPQVDRSPAYYHRLYAHSIAKAVPVVAAARNVYWAAEGDDSGAEAGYFGTRLREDGERIRRYVTASPFPVTDDRAPSDRAARLAFVSHLYNDQFNNPIQAFVPFSVYPSGAWSLWEDIDSAEFRWYLYDKKAIDELREEVFAGGEWRSKISAEALTAGMISRLALSCSTPLERDVVEAAMRSVGVADVRGTVEHKEAEALLIEHEQRLGELIRKFSAPKDLSASRRWAGEGY
jgi:hypothetical protein